MFDFLDGTTETWQWIALISTLIFLGSLLALPFLLSLIPEDYFLKHEDYLSQWKASRPILRIVALTFRNVVGVILILCGIIMLVAPGQGILTILLGLACSAFPGKRTLELRLLRQERVSRSLNWMRSRFDRPPLKLPDEITDSSESN
ncbi:MAG: hypothetical protein HUJ26_19985 [Planctomycetaceae bacterium]|nr:hypothetical protein [Planctomycetaceae bacterium]